MYLLPLIGFSIVAGAVLLAIYLVSPNYTRSAFSVGTAIATSSVFILLQGYHLAYFVHANSPFESNVYIACLFLAPSFFLIFGRMVALPNEPFNTRLLLTFLPGLLPVALPMALALPLLLLCGSVYAGWLGWVTLTLRRGRPQQQFELIFSASMILLASATLLVGAVLPWIEDSYFFAMYSQAIGIGYVLVVFALLAIPDYVEGLFSLAQEKYAATTLGHIDIDEKRNALSVLMEVEAIYTNDALTLSQVAEALDLNGHQLSELVNRHLGLNFSQLLRQYRINAAKDILARNPKQSVLSVALEVGYRSQSTFYTAFKQETGIPPGEYRHSLLHNDESV